MLNMTLFLERSKVFPLATSSGTSLDALAGLLHLTVPSSAYSARMGPVVPKKHHTGSSAVNPAPLTFTTVPPPHVPALGLRLRTVASASGSKYVAAASA